MLLKKLVEELLKHDLQKEVVFQCDIEIYNERIKIHADNVEITEDKIYVADKKSQVVITLHEPDID